MFPTLTPAQIARIAAHGVVRPIARGDVLIEAGDPVVPFFVVKAGEIEIVRPSALGDTLVAVHGPGKFTGEANMILGRRSLTRARVTEPGEVIELIARAVARSRADRRRDQRDPDAGLHLSPARAGGARDRRRRADRLDALRRRRFGSRNSSRATGIRSRTSISTATRTSQDLLDRFHVAVDDIPVLICRGDAVLRNPSNQQIADCLGFNAEHRSDARARRRDRRRRTGGAGGRGVRRLRRTRRAGDRVECAGRAGGLELENRELPRISRPASPARSWPAAPTPRRRSSAPKS